ncbi:protein cutoff [Drosophila subobscura]|uniref:protein cutoff n=1 Tax=Drosophila subobscura TaxID=7241 RepID=UPI00155A8FFC|nr:protein cutoff [Drosophila subobscura]XP_034653092.1 protein cutoff [Drosophila subobscura]
MMNPEEIILNLKPHVITQEDRTVFPTFSKPQTHGGFSLSPDGKFEKNENRKRYLFVPPMGKIQVHLGDSEARRSQRLHLLQPSLDNILLYMEGKGTAFLHTKDQVNVEVNHDIVCSSEVLELILRTPYEKEESWTLAITKYRNTIYISPVVLSEPNNSPMKEMNAEWIETLRRHFLSEKPNTLPEPRGSMEQTGQYHGVFSVTINGKRFIFDAPVLAESVLNYANVKPETKEIFTDLQIRPDNMSVDEWTAHNRSQALKWWIKCFIVGIENIHVAYVNRHIIAHTIEKISVRKIFRDCETVWLPHVCFNFMARLVENICSFTASIDCHKTVYLLTFDAIPGKISYKCYPGRSQFTFIPDWFRIMLEERKEDLIRGANVE